MRDLGGAIERLGRLLPERALFVEPRQRRERRCPLVTRAQRGRVGVDGLVGIVQLLVEHAPQAGVEIAHARRTGADRDLAVHRFDQRQPALGSAVDATERAERVLVARIDLQDLLQRFGGAVDPLGALVPLRGQPAQQHQLLVAIGGDFGQPFQCAQVVLVAPLLVVELLQRAQRPAVGRIAADNRLERRRIEASTSPARSSTSARSPRMRDASSGEAVRLPFSSSSRARSGQRSFFLR